MAKFLLVDDDQDLSSTIVISLQSERHTVDAVYCGEDGLELLSLNQYDAMILDLDMPGIGGLEVLTRHRSAGGCTPVLILTGKDRIEEKEKGLDSGADDYLTKPFSLRELSARLRALGRRPQQVVSEKLSYRDIVLDTRSGNLTRAGAEVKLQPRDLALFEFLLRHPKQVFSIDALLSRVWNYDAQATPDGLRSAISRIRKVLDDENSSESIIENVPKIGYRLR